MLEARRVTILLKKNNGKEPFQASSTLPGRHLINRVDGGSTVQYHSAVSVRPPALIVTEQFRGNADFSMEMDSWNCATLKVAGNVSI